jgi:NADPH-dependent 2,4-dienoyl-CoA reductase/sulfur reductase-like enzyme
MRPAAVDVLIAGGGLAAQRCCETLRRGGFAGSIAMLCEEPGSPYDRPPLSKAVLSAGPEPVQPRFRPEDWYERHTVELLVGAAARELDPSARRVSIGAPREHAGARSIRFGRLVIATGSRPRRLAGVTPTGAVHELRTYADALALRTALRERDGRLAVIGAGLIGMEVAASARALGCDVTMIEAADTPLLRALPPALGCWLAGLHREHGVDVRLSTTLRRAYARRGRTKLELSDGSTLDASTVLVAVGTEPATGWLSSSGLADGAIVTDQRGRTAMPGVYAAGDVACVPDPYLGRTVVTQHWEAAARQGVAVARTILGLAPMAPARPLIWSDQYGRRIQLVGHASGACEVELPAAAASGGAFVAWMRERGRACAALLVDRADALPAARRAIEKSLPPASAGLAA